MERTIWQVISVMIALVAVGLLLNYVVTVLFSSDAKVCEDACDFDGYRCSDRGDDILIESCFDNDYDSCKEYDAVICTEDCDVKCGSN